MLVDFLSGADFNFIYIVHTHIISSKKYFKESQFLGGVFEKHSMDSTNFNDFIQETSARLLKFSLCYGIPNPKSFLQWTIDSLNGQKVYRNKECSILVEKDESCDKCSGILPKRIIKPKEPFKINEDELNEVCEQCDMEFKSKILLNQHIRRKHAKKYVICSIHSILTFISNRIYR